MNSSGNGTTTVTITTPPISNNNSFNLKENTTIINNNTTQQLHIQTTPIQNSINNNNTVTINANNGIKKKRFSINVLNVKQSGADSSDDIETENITFAPTISTPAVKEESIAPWSNVAVSEAIQEIPADYVVDQSCELNQQVDALSVCRADRFFFPVLAEYNVPFERLRNIQKQMSQLNNDLKRTMDECKELYTKHVERLQRERDTALLAASQIEDPNNINAQLPPGVEISNKKVSFEWLISFA